MRAHRALVLAGLLAVVVATPVPAQALQGFVRAQGDAFVLNGLPFRFVGTNAYYMAIMTALGSPAHADDQLALAQALGFTVLRIWGFADGSGTGMGGNAFQTGPGVYNETSFRALDYVLHKADLAGVRLLIPLVNGNPEFGGVPQYLQWCGGGAERAFYETTACKALYKNYISYVLERVNTYNGRRYKDDPAVFAWELANEPHVTNHADSSGQVVRAWVAEIAAHIKSLDPNHMVATGEEGYDVTTSGYSPLSAYSNQGWLFDGNKGNAWTQNTADPNIDFGSIHLYPEYWNLTAAQGNTWIADHVRIARSLGKPLVLGEFGMSQNTAATFDGWLQTLQAEGGNGALAWQVMCGICYGMRDQFGIAYPPASAATTVLAQHAATANAASNPPPFTVGLTTATPAVAAPGQAVTVQTSVSATVAATGVIVDLEVHDAAGVKVAQEAYGGQSFAAGQTRSYTWAWPGSQTPGAYTVIVAVFDGTWSTLYTIADPAASITVQSPAAPSFTVGATSATPSPLAPGQTLTVTSSITAGAAASGIIVDVGIWNAAGTRVAQQAYSGQAFTAGQTRSYTWPWAVPTGLATGTYRVSVGVFDATWTTPYVWVDQSATFAVQPPAPLAFTVGPTTASPDPVRRRQSLTIGTAVHATAAASGIIVDLEIYDPQGRRVAQQVFSGQSFTAGQTRSYTWNWSVGANRARGTYTVRIGIFDASWGTLYLWVNDAETFVVQ